MGIAGFFRWCLNDAEEKPDVIRLRTNWCRLRPWSSLT